MPPNEARPTYLTCRSVLKQAESSSCGKQDKLDHQGRAANKNYQFHRPDRRGKIANGAFIGLALPRTCEQWPACRQQLPDQNDCRKRKHQLDQRVQAQRARFYEIQNRLGAGQAATAEGLGNLQKNDGDNGHRNDLGNARYRGIKKTAPDNIGIDQHHDGNDQQSADDVQSGGYYIDQAANGGEPARQGGSFRVAKGINAAHLLCFTKRRNGCGPASGAEPQRSFNPGSFLIPVAHRSCPGGAHGVHIGFENLGA